MKKLKPLKPLIDKLKKKLDKLKKKLEPYEDLIDQLKEELKKKIVKEFKDFLKGLLIPEFFLELIRSKDPVSTQNLRSTLIAFVFSALYCENANAH